MKASLKYSSKKLMNENEDENVDEEEKLMLKRGNRMNLIENTAFLEE